MPVAIIVFTDGTVPGILSEPDNQSLLNAINGLSAAPGGLDSVAEARAWLLSLPEPSGWFEDAAEARAHLDRMKRGYEMTGGELREIREALGMTREAFATAIGFGGNSNTRHKHIFDMENGAKRILPDRVRRARALAAEVKLTEQSGSAAGKI